MKERVLKLIEENFDKIVEIREKLHTIPELGFKEVQTSEVIKGELEKIGLRYKSGIARTGIVSLIEGEKSGKTVLLRADMDGLPILEESRMKSKSKHKGCMHACGHDGHMASLLGVAMILNELKKDIKGNIKIVFQPAEEGPGGAKPMIEEGVLENPKVDAAFSCHLWPSFLSGQVVIKDGAIMSHATSFDITVIGRGGHGSLPEKTIDPINIGCQIVNNLQNILTREISTFNPAVLSCCHIEAGETYNVIPEKLKIQGTLRSFDEKLTDEILKKMEKIIRGVCDAYDAKYEFLVHKMYPALKNDHELYKFTKKVFSENFREENVIVLKEPIMSSEDFAYFSKNVPSNFFFVGIKDKQKDDELILHHPKLYWDNKEMKTSILALTMLAIEYLNKDN